jgi:uncharacterized protein YecE (DUF72 family)
MGNLHVGTIGWSYSFWKSSFYPPKTSSKEFLKYYASQFDTVEVDSTFYRNPAPQVVANWKSQTPPNFTFSLKFPNLITHIKMLKDSQNETMFFLERTALLGEKRGPMLLQFPPNFGADRYPDLEAYLQQLPKDNRFVVEVRNKGWLKENFYSLLHSHNIALAWVDSPKMPLANEVTSDFLYVRLEGDRKKVNGLLGRIEVDSHEGLQVWAEKLRPFVNKQPVFCYFGKYYSGLPPSDVIFLKELLEQP